MADDYIDVDPDTGEVLRPLPAVVDDVYRPTLVLAPDQAAGLVQQIQELQRSVLRQGVDYDKIPGTPKPSLLKPGAERLLQVFGLGHHMELLSTDTDDSGRAQGFFYRCTVTKGMGDGRVITVSSCDGYCGRDEAKWKNAPLNTILKMAQKRALVGATLTATATSGLFTQDLEDYAHEHPREARSGHTSSSGGSRSAGEPSSGTSDTNLISEPQIKMMLALMTKVGIHDRNIRLQFVRDIIDRPLESSKELTKAEASKVIDKLKEMEAEEAGG